MKSVLFLIASAVLFASLLTGCQTPPPPAEPAAKPARIRIDAPNAPKPIAPYSPAIRVGNLVFLAGHIGTDPATGQMDSLSVENQTKQAMENLKAVLQAAGLTMDNVVKTTIFLADINDFQKVNAIYGPYFTADPPARETVQVAALPRGARIEISMIAAD